MAADRRSTPVPTTALSARPRGPIRYRRLLAATVSLALLIGAGFAWIAYKKLTLSIPRGAPVPALAAGQKDIDGADQNILLIGNDSRAGATPAELKALATQDDGGSVNADTMIVLHLPADGSTPTLISFPRDSWLTIPGFGTAKLNAAYPDGYNDALAHHKSEIEAESEGIQVTIKTISKLTGLHIDHYVQVNLLGFYRISNAIGGVPVCLLHAQKDHYSGIDLPAGRSVIEGTQALAFVRQRHGLPRGDLDRIVRQQYFLNAAFHKIASAGVLLNPFKLNALMKAVQRSILVDPALNVMSLARQLADLTSGRMNTVTIPNGGPQMIYPDGVATAIVSVNTAAMPAFIKTIIGESPDAALAKVTAAAPSTVTVDVLNGTDITGLAGRNAQALRELGFRTATIDSTNASTSTVIEYRSGQESAAKALAAVVPHAKLALTADVDRPTLILGSDGVQVKGAPGSSSGASANSSAAASGSASGSAGSPAASSSAASPAAGMSCIN